METQKFTTTLGTKELTIEIGAFAQSANASCMVQMGETVVMATAVMSGYARDGINYFPLMVDYEEKLYAAGRIKGSRFIKREGRPTDNAVLIGRFIDRALRPLFDQSMRKDVQVIVSVLAFDEEHDPDILGLIAASTALHISDIPWAGPIGATRISKTNDTWTLNPTYGEREKAEFDLDLAGTSEKIIMIEAEGDEATEEDLLDGFKRGAKVLDSVIALIEEVRSAVGKEKMDFSVKTDEAKAKAAHTVEVEAAMREFFIPRINEALFTRPIITKAERNSIKSNLSDEAKAHFEAQDWPKEDVRHALGMVYDLVLEQATNQILTADKRIDGRKIDEVRPLTIDIDLLPRVHGTGHFNRGGTQVMSVVTLGAPGDKQTLDGMEVVEEKRYFHHYNFPPFSVGEAKPLRGASRRDIGHGALAEKALKRMLPELADFPYTIRVVSEVLDSNGSSSMASTCGSSLALMDAGVPIKKAVAGIAMGLASNDSGWKVITDLQDLEDGPGGMDFKVTGTDKGITAIQMDTKTHGVSVEIIEECLVKGKVARLGILEKMNAVISEPRPDLSPYAPRIISLKIDPEKIRDVIGPGGKMINEIIEKTAVESIDIEQDGTVMITAKDGESGDKALEWIHNLTREVQVGEVFEGTVVRLMDFGAFVEVLPGKDGLVHVSELAPWRVAKVDDIVKVDDKVQVKVMEIDSQGRINLSMKSAEGNTYTDEMKAKAVKSQPRSDKPHQKRD